MLGLQLRTEPVNTIPHGGQMKSLWGEKPGLGAQSKTLHGKIEY